MLSLLFVLSVSKLHTPKPFTPFDRFRKTFIKNLKGTKAENLHYPRYDPKRPIIVMANDIPTEEIIIEKRLGQIEANDIPTEEIIIEKRLGQIEANDIPTEEIIIEKRLGRIEANDIPTEEIIIEKRLPEPTA